MTDFLAPTYNAISTAVKAAWPEVITSGAGIWHAMDLRREAFETRAKAGELPAAAFEFLPGPDADWGADNNVLEGALYIYYVLPLTSTSPGFEAAIGKALIMCQYLRNNDLAAGQCIKFPVPRCDMTLPANQFFLSANKPYFASAAVCYEFVTGEGP